MDRLPPRRFAIGNDVSACPYNTSPFGDTQDGEECWRADLLLYWFDNQVVCQVKY